ncbi:phosphate acetyltransferase [Chlorobium sp. N1]|nr:phosphate acetyltransferase [Chlorobium sp. N1]
MESCRDLQPLVTAVVHPVDRAALEAARDAADEGLITPVLVGPRGRIRGAAEACGIDISQWRMVDARHSHEAADLAVKLAAAREAGAIMKGSLHTDELLQPIVARSSPLRTERRLSHAYAMDTAGYHKWLLVTDAVVNIAPDLEAKADIVRNAVDLWRAFSGSREPAKVAVLAAIEFVNPRMAATIDAAALCKMADRGQIQGCIIDGPLAFDNAVSREAAEQKGIVSPVAGDPDILLVPDIEAGNILAKQLTFIDRADAGGLVMGGVVPVMLASRADSLRTRLLSCALGVLAAREAEGRRGE